MFFVSTLDFYVALAGLCLAVVTIALYIDYFVWKGKYLSDRVQEAAWPAIIFVTIASIVISLTYSEYFGIVPCSLCWLQRIAAYPQALLALIAAKRKDTVQFPLYGIGLSLFGFLVAVYQYIYQAIPKTSLPTGFTPCLVDGSGADCAVKVINQFGFVTFPFVSAVTFAFLIIMYLYMFRPAKTANK